MTITSAELGKRIKEARVEKRLSQEELGARLNPPRSHAAISDMERGVTRVGAMDVDQLAQILDKPTGYFYGEGTPPHMPAPALFGRGSPERDVIERFKRDVSRELERRKKESQD